MKYYLNILLLLLIGCNEQKPIDKMDVERENQLFKKAASFRQGSEMEWVYFDSIIALNPNYDRVWFEKAAWSIKTGNYINYMKYINKAIDISNDGNLGYRGSIKLRFLRDYEGAIKDLNQLLSMYPNQTEIAAWGTPVLLLLGKAYWQMKEYQMAIDYFDRYIREEREASGEDWIDVNAFLCKGICLYELGKYEEALEAFEKAIKYDGKFPDAYFHAGVTLIKLKENRQACDYFFKAKQYAENGQIKRDTYREVFGQLYYNDILLAMQENCQ